jgi:hypothetical protein
MSRAWIRLFALFILFIPLAGCGESNDKEFLNSAPPGSPPENPGEGYAARRERVNAKTEGETPKPAQP